MQIIAICIVSLSELQTINADYTEEWASNNPEELKQVLHGLGMDIDYPVDRQEVTHRNRFGNVITCSRWVGNERVDKQWVKSGYASQAAIDKSLKNKLITDLYRLKGMVE